MTGAMGRGPGGAGICLLVGLLVFSGCGRYADFKLPPVSGGDPNMTFTFEAQAEPVLTGEDGWESHDVLNPSVISEPRPLAPGPRPLSLLYSGFDGHTWRTGLASSGDGAHWHKDGVILSPDPQTWEGSYIAANGSALWYENQFWYWYQAGPRERPRIGLARPPLSDVRGSESTSEPRTLESGGRARPMRGLSRGPA